MLAIRREDYKDLKDLLEWNEFTWKHFPYPLYSGGGIAPPSISDEALQDIKNHKSLTLPVFHFDRYYDSGTKKMTLITDFSDVNMLRLKSMYHEKVPNIYHIGSSGYFCVPIYVVTT